MTPWTEAGALAMVEHAGDPCPGGIDFGDREAVAVAEAGGAYLVAVPCVHYVTNIDWRLVVVDGEVRPIEAPQYENGVVADEALALGVGGRDDPETFTTWLPIGAHGCGGRSRFRFDGHDVELLEVREEGCHAWPVQVTEPDEWPVVYPAERRIDAGGEAAAAAAGACGGVRPAAAVAEAGGATLVAVRCADHVLTSDWVLASVRDGTVDPLRHVEATGVDAGVDGRFTTVRLSAGCAPGVDTTYEFDGEAVAATTVAVRDCSD